MLQSSRGLAYTYCNGKPAPLCSWSFWLFNKSKKVWFRLEGPALGSPIAPHFTYRGREILHGARRRAFTRGATSGGGPAAVRPICWGKHLGNGWGEGPGGTNYYLSIWTRWSWLHPAWCHPDRFEMLY